MDADEAALLGEGEDQPAADEAVEALAEATPAAAPAATLYEYTSGMMRFASLIEGSQMFYALVLIHQR